MQSVSIKLDKELTFIELHTASDWHIGDNSCDMTRIRKTLDEIKEKDNAFLICNGDLINNATKTSVSDCYAESVPPMEQLKMLCGLLEPLREKILLVTSGNHEARTYRSDGIDLTRLVARELGIENRYCREGGVLFLSLGTQSRGAKKTNKPNELRQVAYSIYASHGAGGGRKEGAKAIRLADMASIIDCDIYIHSHTHLPMIMKQAFYRIDNYNKTFALVDKLFVNTSAQLEYGGYGQTFEFKPSSKANPVIYLNGTRKEFTAKL